ncbi:MAG TPA: alpha/beta hydrolase [Streptosporangiaceae bacterium]|nr:alpha/beta hydrolase [Streptosporangiaceae bacterium]
MPEYVRTSAGIALDYDLAGDGVPPMLFVHGWGCDRSSFAAQISYFRARHTVAALDLRGHGDSDQPAPQPGIYDVAAFVADTLAVADAAGLDRPVIVGHSLGALVALACAANPDLTRAAVMIEPALTLTEDARAFHPRFLSALAADHDGSARAAMASGLFLRTDTVGRKEIIAGIVALPAAIATAAWQAIATFDGASALGEVQVPLLSISSGDAPAALRELCPGIVRGQTVGSGRFPQVQIPDQVNAMIDRFLLIN